jgi:DNA-binding CsgD family transcriptional regulator
MRLTARELQVLRLVREDYTDAEIGDRLRISEHTVAMHLRSAFDKLDLPPGHGRRHLAVRAVFGSGRTTRRRAAVPAAQLELLS